jgi:hypothetical protein
VTIPANYHMRMEPANIAAAGLFLVMQQLTVRED